MKRSTLLKVVNLVLAVLFLNQVLTGLFHSALPHEAYEVLHEGGGIAFAIAGLLHLILNWNWVKANFLPKPRQTNP